MGIRTLIRRSLRRLDSLFQTLGLIAVADHPANGGITGDLDSNADAQSADSQCNSSGRERNQPEPTDE